MGEFKLNKNFLIFGLLFLVLISGVSASLLDDMKIYYKLDEGAGTTAIDYMSYVNGTISGATYTTGLINTGLLFSAGTNRIDISSGFIDRDNTESMTTSAWVNTSSNTKQFIFGHRNGNTIYYLNIEADLTLRFYVRDSASTVGSIYCHKDITDGNFHLVTGIYNATSDVLSIYINQTLCNSTSYTVNAGSHYIATASTFKIGSDESNADAFNGIIDEIGIWYTDKSSDLETLYNLGVGLQPPFVTKFLITTNLADYNITMVSNETKNYDSNTTTFTTGLELTDERLWNITLIPNSILYNNLTFTNYNISLNGSLTTSFTLKNANISFTANEIITNNNIYNFNISLGNGTILTDSNSSHMIAYGYYNLTFIKSPYYNLTLTNQLISTDTTIDFPNIYASILNVTFNTQSTNTTINQNGNFSFTFGGSNHEYIIYNGSSLLYLPLGTYTNINARTGNYAYLTPADFTLTTATATKIYYFYEWNSVWFYAKDFVTATNLTNFQVTIYNENTTITQSNTTGEVIKINNLTNGQYKALFIKEDYNNAEYIVSVSDGSYQTLTAYLINDTLESTTNFLLKDRTSGGIISGATISMYNLINDSWALVSSSLTDITGRLEIKYIPDREYKFIVTITGYETREFLLKPTYTQYTIYLTSIADSLDTSTSGDFYYIISNNGLFYDDSQNNFSISILSGAGSIEDYVVRVSLANGTSVTASCINAYGCTDDLSLNIAGASFLDVVAVNFSVNESGKDTKNIVINYKIQSVPSTRTFANWINAGEGATDEGLGDLEKAMISTIIMIIVTGVIASLSIGMGVPPVTTSGITLTITSGLFAFVNFIPNYAFYLIGIGALLIVLFGRGQI
jgi:5-hydroxyisourate hydrolase-like protein (transthyretin family)